LEEYYDLTDFPLTHSSYIGSNNSVELISAGNIEQEYGIKYPPAATTIPRASIRDAF